MSEEQKKDELADALAALAAGQHPEEPVEGSGMAAQAHLEGIGETPSAPPPPRPVPPSQRPPTAAAPAPRSGAPAPRAAGGPPRPAARAAAPVPTRSPALVSPPEPPAGPPKPPTAPPAPAGLRPGEPPRPRTASPTTPSSPPRPSGAPKPSTTLRPASPHSKARPTTPGQMPPTPSPAPPPVEAPPEEFVRPDLTADERAAQHDAEVAAEADAIAHVVEDDDTLNLPAPPPEAFAHRPPPPRPYRPASRTVGFKQTMIPILLTMGVMLSGIAAWSFVLGEESPVAGHAWIPIAVLAIGVVMLGFAVMTMLQVRNQLAAGRIET